MKQFKCFLVLALLAICVEPIDAKVQDVCKGMLYFDGELVKDKQTKQKIPSGEGKLFIKYSNSIDNIAIVGNFQGNTVSDATFAINDEGKSDWNNEYSYYWAEGKIFQGTISYTYSFDKESKELLLTVNLLDGELLCKSDFSLSVPVKPEDNFRYSMAFKKSDWIPYQRHYKVYPTTIKFSTPYTPNQKSTNTSSTKDILSDESISPLASMIVENNWEAKECRGSWNLKWVGAKLNNGAEVNAVDYNYPGHCCNFTITGPNGVYLEKYASAGKLPLSDGGYFSWNDGRKTMRLYYPNGDVYDGSFNAIPFVLEPIYNVKNLAVTSKQIMESSTSNFGMADGTYTTHASNKTERVKDGKFIDQLLTNNASSDLDYSSLISGARLLSDNYDDYYNLCKRDFWKYIGKDEISELDKTLFKETPEYTTRHKAYQDALNGLYYEVVPCYASDFTTKGANIYKDIPLSNTAAKKLPLLPIDRNTYRGSAFPLKSSCVATGDYNRIKLSINSTDINFLKYLQDVNADKELALLCIMKPGASVDYFHYDAIPTAVGLYLINKNTYTVLADLSKYIDTANPNKYKGIFKQINAQDDAADKRREQEWMREYKKTYGQNASPCPKCAGTGHLTYWGNGGSYKRSCQSCGGTGRIYKR